MPAMRRVLLIASMLIASSAFARAFGQDSLSPSAAPMSQAPETPPVPAEAAPPQVALPPSNFDPAIFQRPIPPADLAFISQFAGATSNELYRDKQFRKLMKAAIPDCMFHYGRDKLLFDALDEAIQGSRVPVQMRDRRYVLLGGQQGQYLGGRGFLWIDLKEGFVIGGFYFQPTNGEPTPSLTIFSRQIRENALAMSELPPAFAQDLAQWTLDARVPPVETRYFIGGVNKRLLLEHDEEYCLAPDGSTAPADSGCQQMDADAADLDLNAANYLEQVHHATNATAWMVNSPEQITWLRVRDNTCGVTLSCRIRITRERTRTIVRGGPHPGRR